MSDTAPVDPRVDNIPRWVAIPEETYKALVRQAQPTLQVSVALVGPICWTHDPVVNPIEEADWEAGGDPCMFVWRAVEDVL